MSTALVRTGSLTTASTPEGFCLGGWEFTESYPMEPIACGDHYEYQRVRTSPDIRITADALVRQDLWPAFQALLKRSMGTHGPYRLEKPGTVISGLAITTGFEATTCCGCEFGLPADANPSDWLQVSVNLKGIDSGLGVPAYTESLYQLSLVEKVVGEVGE